MDVTIHIIEILMAWKGVIEDHYGQRIVYNIFDGNNWSSPRPIGFASPGVNYPSLASLGRYSIVTWRANDQRIVYNKFDCLNGSWSKWESTRWC
jgi:hypothetical protein